MASKETTSRELTITRDFDAPREDVFNAWVEADRVKQWWGPNGFTTPVCQIDFRPGGEFRYCMRSPEGRNYCGKGVYQEIIVSERIVVTDSFTDEQGTVVPASYYGMHADFPEEMLMTITFIEQDGRTRVTLEHVGIPEGADRDGAIEGWSQSFDRLAEYLLSQDEE